MGYLPCPHCSASNRDTDASCYTCGLALGGLTLPGEEPTHGEVGNLILEGVVSGFLLGLVMAVVSAAGISAVGHSFPDSLAGGLARVVLGYLAALQVVWCIFLGGLLGHLGVLGEAKPSMVVGALLTALWSFAGLLMLPIVAAYGALLGFLCHWITGLRLRK